MGENGSTTTDQDAYDLDPVEPPRSRWWIATLIVVLVLPLGALIYYLATRNSGSVPSPSPEPAPKPSPASPPTPAISSAPTPPPAAAPTRATPPVPARGGLETTGTKAPISPPTSASHAAGDDQTRLQVQQAKVGETLTVPFPSIGARWTGDLACKQLTAIEGQWSCTKVMVGLKWKTPHGDLEPPALDDVFFCKHSPSSSIEDDKTTDRARVWCKRTQ